MLVCNNNVPLSVKKTLTDFFNTEINFPLNDCNPQTVLKIFQLALNHRQEISASFEIWKQIRILKCSKKTKFEIYGLGLKVFFGKSLDDYVDSLIQGRLPFSIITKNHHLVGQILRHVENHTPEEVDEWFNLINQLPEQLGQQIIHSLCNFPPHSIKEVLRELIRQNSLALYKAFTIIVMDQIKPEDFQHVLRNPAKPLITLLKTALPLFKHEKAKIDQLDILIELCKAAPAHRQNIVEACEILFPKVGLNKWKLIEKLSDLRYPRVLSTIEHVLPVIKNNSDDNEIANLIEVLDRFPIHHQREAIDLLKEARIDMGRSSFLNAMLEIPQEKRTSIWEVIKKNCIVQSSSAGLSSLILTLGNLYGEELQTFFDLVFHHFPKLPKHKLNLITILLGKIGMLRKDKRKKYLEICQGIFEKLRTYDNLSFVLDKVYTFCEYDEKAKDYFLRLYKLEKNLSVIVNALKCLMECPKQKRKGAIEALEKTPGGKRDNFVHLIEFYIAADLGETEPILTFYNKHLKGKITGSFNPLTFFLQISTVNRSKFMNAIEPIIKHVKYGEDIQKVLELLASQEEDITELCALAEVFLIPSRNTDCEAIFKALIAIPSAKRRDYVTSLVPVLNEDMTTAECGFLIESLIVYPPTVLPHLIKLIIPLLRENSDVKQVINCIRGTPVKIIKKRITTALRFQEDYCKYIPLGNLFVKLCEIPETYLKNVIEKTDSINTQFPHIEDKENLFNIVFQNRCEHFDEILNKISALDARITSTDQLSNLLQGLVNIPHDKLLKIIQASRGLFKDFDADKQGKLYMLIWQYKEDRWEELMCDIEFLTAGCYIKTSKLEIIETYLATTTSKFNLKKRLTPFLRICRYDRLDLIKNLLSLSSKVWHEIVPLCQPLIDQCPHNPHLWVKILVQISQVYPKQRKNIVHHLAALKLSPHDWSEIILALQKVPGIHRDQLMKDAEVLFNSMRDTNIPRILLALNEIPAVIRQQVVSDYLVHFKDAQENEAAVILKGLSTIPEDRRQALFAFLSSYFSTCQSSITRLHIMVALNDLPEDQWDAALSCALQLLPLAQSLEYLLPFLMKQKEQEREFCLTYAKANFRKGQLCEDQIVLLEETLLIDDEDTKRMIDKIDQTIGFMSIKQRIQAIKIVKASQKEILNEILTTQFWLKRSFFPNHYLDILNKLTFFPKEEIQPVLDIVLPILPILPGKKEEFVMHLLENFRNLPHELRASYTHIVLFLVMGQRVEGQNLGYVCRVLSRLADILVLKKILPHVKPVLNKIHNVKERIDFLYELQGSRIENLAEACTLMEDRFPNVGAYHGSLISLLTQLPRPVREQLFSRTLEFSHFTSDPSVIYNILKRFIELKSHEREQIIQFSQLLLDNDFNLRSFELFLTEILEIDADIRAEVIQLSLNYPFNRDIQRIKLLKFLERILRNNEQEQLLQLAPIVQNMRDECSISACVPIFLKMLAEDRQDLLSLSKKASKKFYNPTPFIKIMFSLRNDHLHHMLGITTPLFDHVDNVYFIESVLEQLGSIPFEDREYMVKLILPLFKRMRGAKHGTHLKQILSDLYSIPKNEHAEIMELIRYPEKKFAEQIAQLVHVLVSFEQADRKSIVQAALPFRDDLPAPCYVDLISSIGEYTPEERALGLHVFLEPLFREVDNPSSQFNLLSMLSWFPAKERKAIIEMVSPLIRCKGEGNEFIVLHNFLLIAPHYRKEVADKLMKYSMHGDVPTLESLFNDHHEIRLASHDYLLTLLESSIENKKISFLMANTILKSSQEIFLHEEHPVFQKALEIVALHTTDTDRLNPYILFRSLKLLLAKEELVTFKTPVSTLENRRVSIPLEKWRTSVQSKPHCLGDLPKGLPKGHFAELFKAFHDRLEGLPKILQAQIQQYISTCFVNDSYKLEEAFLDKHYIRSLFQICGSPELVVESPVFYIHSILKHVCDQSDTVKEGKYISEREEALLKVSCSINECKTGQRDGIVSFYNYLPVQYKINAEMSKMEPEARLAELVKRSIQGVLQQTFANIDFIKLLDPTATSSQYPHKALYLMNRLHKQVGYDHRLTFDANTGLVPKILLDIPVDDLLQKFFTICTPERLILRLQRDIAEALKNKSIAYMDMMYTIEQARGDIVKSIIVDDKDFPIGVTVEGALSILMFNEALI